MKLDNGINLPAQSLSFSVIVSICVMNRSTNPMLTEIKMFSSRLLLVELVTQ